MSIQSLKNALLDQKKNQIAQCADKHRHTLQALYSITNLVGVNAFFAQPPNTTVDEAHFLNENDLTQGHHFREATLAAPIPKPSTSLQATDIPTPKLPVNVPSPLSPGPDFASRSSAIDHVKLAPSQLSKPDKASSTTPVPITHTPPRSANASPNLDSYPASSTNAIINGHRESPSNHADSSQKSDRVDDQPSRTSQKSGAHLKSSPHSKATSKGDVEVDAQDSSRGKDAEENVVDGAPNSMEAASSPSSTAGAYSTSTPKPAPPSPDTSPEAAPSPVPHPDLVDESSASVAETSAANVSPSKSGPAGPITDATPEAQLRLEEAQANEAASRSSNNPNVVTKDAHRDSSSQAVTDQSKTSSSKKDSTAMSTALSNGSNQPSMENGDVEMTDDTPKKLNEAQSSKPGLPQTPADSTPSRMRTRVASGAIRQKSVSEILGEMPKPSSHLLQPPADIKERKATDRHDQTRKSTVVFSKDKDLTSQALRSELDSYLALKGASLDPEKDYLRPLFLFQAWQPPRGQTLAELILHTRKAITTSDMVSSARETIDYRILRRIYQLQNANKWSLRQPTKYPDPAPVRSHWDLMLDEMKWMRTDFREERKWKTAVARNLANWCATYCNASDEEKVLLRVKVTPRRDTRVIADSFDEPPELISAGTSEASEDDIPLALAVQTPPHTLFSLGFDDVVFQIDDTPSAHALVGELPFYDPKAQAQPNDSTIPVPPKDNILPVSKFVTGKIVPKTTGAPKKRSRFDYEQSEEEYGSTHKRARSDSSAPFLSPARRSSPKTEIPPEDQEVALFNPVNKHILTRIRATNSFRPPSEFQMPSQSFYENRFQSKWTWEEDQRLRHCVRQYQYNWSLIAQDLQTRCQSSQYVSGVDRRTPWECFERWTQLEGLPADLNRSLYFKAYSQRIEAAIRAVQEKPAASVQSAGGVRVRGLPPDKISQRRDSRHISMIDAMRRLARRRENTIHRQQEAMKTAAMRKVHADGNPNMPRIKKMTPQEWSHERHQADVKRTLQMQKDLQDREEARRQQQAAMAGRAVPGQLPLTQQQMQVAAAAAAAQRRNAMGAAQNLPQQGATPQVNQAAHVQKAMQNGAVNGMGLAGLTQAQQLQALQNLQQQAARMPQNTTEAAQLAALQQRQLQQMGQLPSQTANLVAAHLSPSGGNMQNTHQQQILAAMQRANFVNANGIGAMNGMGSSPTSAANNTLNNTILSLMHRIQQGNPHLTSDQIRRLATEQVRRTMNQNALAAASGASSVAGLGGLPSQQAALAQQHLGLHGQANPQMLAAYAAHAAQQQAVQNAGLGPMASPAQGLAAAVMVQGQQMAGAANANSPTQMYGRPMTSAQAQVAAAHQRMPSGSPGLVPARPESRGGAGTPGLNGMVRSMSGTASQSPILGGAGGGGQPGAMNGGVAR